MLKISGVKIGHKSSIHNVKFFHFGKLSIGNSSTINSGCYLDNRRQITIGNNVSIAHNSKIYTLGHSINDPHFKTVGKSVIIEDYVCIFANTMIMPGVRIKKGAVILPGAIVTKDVEEFTVVGGNPAKFVKNRIKKLDYKVEYNYWFAI